MSEKTDTVDPEGPVDGVAVDWGTDFSVFSKELEEARARIESLKVDADETATLKREIHDKDLALENKNSEIRAKHELINALRQGTEGTEGTGRFRDDGKTKDQEIARLTKEKQQAEQQAAELTEEFKMPR